MEIKDYPSRHFISLKAVDQLQRCAACLGPIGMGSFYAYDGRSSYHLEHRPGDSGATVHVVCGDDINVVSK